jgi:hypothetical protein
MVFIVIAGVLGGHFIDKFLHLNPPIFTFILSVLSILLALYYVLKQFLK